MPSDISYSKLLCMRLALAKLSNISHVCKNLESFLQLLILLFPFRFELQILFHHSSHAQCNGLHYGTLSQYVWLKNIHRKCKKREKMQRKLATLRLPRASAFCAKIRQLSRLSEERPASSLPQSIRTILMNSIWALIRRQLFETFPSFSSLISAFIYSLFARLV